MKVGIHLEPFNQFSTRLKKFEDILLYNSIDTIRLDSSNTDFWNQIKNLDLFIYNFAQYDHDMQKARAILPIIEFDYKVKCFPDLSTYWHYDDKIRQYYLMKRYDYPMTESYIYFEKEKALEWAEFCTIPVVFKLKGGAGSKNVIIVNEREQLKKLIFRMFSKGISDNGIPGHTSLRMNFIDRFKRKIYIKKLKFQENIIPFRYQVPNWIVHKNYVLFQKFLPNNDFDTRVTTVGNVAFAFRRFNRTSDFRSSGSGLIDHDPQKIDLNCVKKALQISEKMKYQTMAYDILYNENNEIEFCEMSYNYLDSTVYKCHGYWDKSLKWQEGHYWPQYLLLKQLLNMDDLKQPQF